MPIFMYIEGITGECSDANHKGWIDIERIKWGASRSIRAAEGYTQRCTQCLI